MAVGPELPMELSLNLPKDGMDRLPKRLGTVTVHVRPDEALINKHAKSLKDSRKTQVHRFAGCRNKGRNEQIGHMSKQISELATSSCRAHRWWRGF
jgi:hypothetical protein